MELPSGDARRRFIEEACRGDRPLQPRVEHLIANDLRAGSFLNTSAGDRDYSVEATTRAAGGVDRSLAAEPGGSTADAQHTAERLAGQAKHADAEPWRPAGCCGRY